MLEQIEVQSGGMFSGTLRDRDVAPRAHRDVLVAIPENIPHGWTDRRQYELTV